MKRVQRHTFTMTLLLGALLATGLAEGKPAQHSTKKSPAAKAQASPKEGTSKHGVVNLNTASEAQLCLLPRIGPAKARAIIKYRSKQKFKGTWDLVRVKGIGQKIYRQLRPLLTVQGETTLTRKPTLEKENKG